MKLCTRLCFSQLYCSFIAYVYIFSFTYPKTVCMVREGNCSTLSKAMSDNLVSMLVNQARLSQYLLSMHMAMFHGKLSTIFFHEYHDDTVKAVDYLSTSNHDDSLQSFDYPSMSTMIQCRLIIISHSRPSSLHMITKTFFNISF